MHIGQWTYIKVPCRDGQFPQKILTFFSWENIYWKLISLIEIWITRSQKELAKPQSQNPKIHFRKGDNKGTIFFPLELTDGIRLNLSPFYLFVSHHNSGINLIHLLWTITTLLCPYISPLSFHNSSFALMYLHWATTIPALPLYMYLHWATTIPALPLCISIKLLLF